jgi:hypothetical protein
MRPLARVLIDESHRQAWTTRPEVAARMNPVNPADASYQRAAVGALASGLDVVVHESGPLDDAALAHVDALVLPHAADDAWEHTTGIGSPRLTEDEIAALERFVIAGGGLVILGETEQPKYGNNFADLAMRFGIEIDNSTVQDPAQCYREVPTWVLADLVRGEHHDLTAKVAAACFYRAGSLHAGSTNDAVKVETIARTSGSADPSSASLVMTASTDGGRVVVTADSDLFGDDSILDLDHEQLWLNLLTWAAGGRAAGRPRVGRTSTWAQADPDWLALAGAVEAIRTMQSTDGAIDLSAQSDEEAQRHVDAIVTSLAALAPRFAHQADHLAATIVDLQSWAASGFGVPDFLDSLILFRPDLNRANGVEHLAVFPMYTQNGNLSRNFEAVITRTFWPDWLAQQESAAYDNAAFVPIEFVAFTSGYDTHSAVFFPETVATRETPEFHWGGIFCDREAARFRLVARKATNTLRLSLPSDVDLLLNDQQLAQETFVLWDLIHDRTHSRGDLPFDPFMIKQRMPFWMYALEELRCDLATFRETLQLDERNLYLGRFIRYAILFDRLFRFTITGSRVRNYDGLGGQIIFAWLHRDDVLRWTDNTLTIDWDRVTPSMVALCDEVENLYRTGIDRSRVAQWIAAHEFVSGLVAPNPASVWAQGPQALPLDGEPKAMVDVVLPDEFPLNVFFDSLQRKLAATIASTAGITA